MMFVALSAAFVIVALTVWAIRARRARPVTGTALIPEITPMRATLERRMRDGGDFHV